MGPPIDPAAGMDPGAMPPGDMTTNRPCCQEWIQVLCLQEKEVMIDPAAGMDPGGDMPPPGGDPLFGPEGGPSSRRYAST